MKRYFCNFGDVNKVILTWPPDSPDLNPVDYKIWGLMQDCVYQTTIHDVDKPKQHLIAVWADMKQSVINKAIDEWCSRLTACVHAKGDILNICFVEHEHYTSSLV